MSGKISVDNAERERARERERECVRETEKERKARGTVMEGERSEGSVRWREGGENGIGYLARC